MILDGKQLKAGDLVYSLFRGDGMVFSVTPTDANVKFGDTIITISSANVMQGDVKVIGLGKPLVYWPSLGQNREVSAYLPIIRAMELLK